MSVASILQLPVAERATGELSIAVDPLTNRIVVTGRGYWSLDLVKAHIAEFEIVLRQARHRDRPSRTLVDLRESSVQSAEVAAALHDAMTRMYQAPERAAIVVASNLVKMQMKRGFNPQTHAVFTSHSAAELWLSVTGT